MLKIFKKLKLKNKKIAKTPIIVQLEVLDCAAACLCMILAFYKKFVPLEQLRIDCKINKHGSNAKNIVEAANKHGLDAFGLKIEPEELKKNGNFPCIIHWNFNHFVILSGFKNEKAVLCDPAIGLNLVDFTNFCKSFTGICLNFKPNKNFQPGGKPKTTTKFFIKILKNSFKAFIVLSIISILNLFIKLIEPGFLHFLIDKILTGQNIKLLLPFAAIMVATTLANLALLWLKNVHFLKVQGALFASGSCKFVWKMINLPLEFFSTRLTGEIQNRKQFNSSIANQILSQFTPLILNAINLTMFYLIMLRYNAFLTIVLFLTNTTAILISKFSLKNQLNLEKIKLKHEGKLAAITVSALKSIETIKANGTENQFFQQWADAQAQLNAQTLKDPPLATLPKFIANLSPKITIIFGAILMVQNRLTLGMIVAFNMFLKNMVKPFDNFLNYHKNLKNLRTKIERIEDIMNYNQPIKFYKKTQNSKKYRKKLSGKIEIKNLKFSHTGENKPLLNNFNLKIEPGEKIAIVGPSGCGKTTLVKLMTGLLWPQQGEILFDGKQINEIEKSLFKNSIAVVANKPFFFTDTIKNNLTMFSPEVNELNLIKAAKKAQIYYTIEEHGGFTSKVLEHAKNFSSSQKQKLDIARALVKEPQILILDEATSSIDLQTELKIFENLLKESCSCIFISKLGHIPKFCTKIVHMN